MLQLKIENLFSGTSKILDSGTSLIDIGGGLKMEASDRKAGDVTLFVKPEDIIISEKALVSSARNTLKGEVIGIMDLGAIVKLRIFAAGKEFIVQITKRSFAEMSINLNSVVFITFKASSIHFI